MTKRMLIDATHPEETRVVVLNENRLEELDLDTQNRKQLKGNIYLAKVIRIEPALQAAFVDYGGNRHGFLAFSEIHPDYYQIPVADRQRILDIEAGLEEDSLSELVEEGYNQNRQVFLPPDSEEKTTTVAEETLSFKQEKSVLTSDSEEKKEPDEAKNHFGRFKRSQPLKRGLYRRVRKNLDWDTFDSADPEEKQAEGEKEQADFLSENNFLPDLSNTENPIKPKTKTNIETQTEDFSEVSSVSHAEEIQEEPLPETFGGEPDTDIGREENTTRKRPPRFLRQYKIQEVLKRRQILLVQVVKEERGNKGAALTTYLSLAGRYSVLMPNSLRSGGISRKITSVSDRKRLHELTEELKLPRGIGLIVRTAGANRPKVEIQRDCEYLLRLWDEIRELTLQSVAPALIYEEGNLIKRAIRDIYARDIDEVLVAGEDGWRTAQSFMRTLIPSHAKKVKLWQNPATSLFARYQVEAQLENMLNPIVALSSGGYLVINQTEALVAIDVNSGRATRERDLTDTALKTNLEAAEEIARQVRLRDLAGLIVIDFIDMDTRKHNGLVEKKLKEALKADRARLQVGHISHFGLLELSRQRLRPSLAESSLTLCPNCEGRGFVRTPESAAIYVLRAIEEEASKYQASEILVSTAGSIAFYILNNKRERLGEIEFHAQMKVRFIADDQLPVPQYRIERLKPAISPNLQTVSQNPISPDLYLRHDLDFPSDMTSENSPEEALSEEIKANEISDFVGENDSKLDTLHRSGPSGRRHRRKRRHGRGNKNEIEEISEKLPAFSESITSLSKTEITSEFSLENFVPEEISTVPTAETTSLLEETLRKKTVRRRRSSFHHHDKYIKGEQTQSSEAEKENDHNASELTTITRHYEPVNEVITYTAQADKELDKTLEHLNNEMGLLNSLKKRRDRSQTVTEETIAIDQKTDALKKSTFSLEKATTHIQPTTNKKTEGKKRRPITEISPENNKVSEVNTPTSVILSSSDSKSVLEEKNQQKEKLGTKYKRRQLTDKNKASTTTTYENTSSSEEPKVKPARRRRITKTTQSTDIETIKVQEIIEPNKKAIKHSETNVSIEPASIAQSEKVPKKGWWKH